MSAFPITAFLEGMNAGDGYSLKKAALTADWLKGRDCYQAACDAN